MKKSLVVYTYLSIIASILVITLKFSAFLISQSVGLLSDAIESFINLSGSLFAFFMLKLAEKPPDQKHPYGHSKAEYFSSLFEGILILSASAVIFVSALERIINPKPLENVFFGLSISLVSLLINLYVGRTLVSAGKKYQSISLEADGKHLLTDVYSSVSVIVGVILVEITKILILDPLMAILIGANILTTSLNLMKRSISGFLDESLEKRELIVIEEILKKYEKFGINFHSLRSRQSAQKKFLNFHILFPNHWSVKKAHDLVYKIENEIKKKIANIEIESHLEPISDKKSFDD
ncbi:MAG: cation diffusion facilitator family transporter [Patescibacteria group bacterium]|nr:cation diffusion facilitator family transporter [Patescibacteria group bacterium]